MRTFLFFLLYSFTLFTCVYSKSTKDSSFSKINNKEVKVGVSIVQIFKVDGANTQFRASGYIYYTWIDSTMSYKPNHPSDTLRATNKTLQSDPRLEFVNGQKIEYDYESDLLIKPNGLVINKKKFQGTFSSPMNLRKFPFDKQKLELIIEPFLFDTNFCKLDVKPELLTLGENVHLDEWIFYLPSYNTSFSISDPTGNAPFSRITIQFVAERNWGYYVWKIMFYLFIFVLISTGVYYVPPSDAGTSVRITITMLLTVIAFHITLTDRIPSLNYRTFMDDLDYLSLIAILYNFGLVLLNKHLFVSGKEILVGRIIYFHRLFFIPALILTFFILLFLRLHFA